VFAPGKLF